jgi:hypothetical protein
MRGLRNQTVLIDSLDRTQEVGGSNPPSSIDEEGLQKRHFVFRKVVRTTLPLPPIFGH